VWLIDWLIDKTYSLRSNSWKSARLFVHVQNVVEKCVYTPSKDNQEWTECQREAWVSSGVFGFARALQAFGMERFKKNVHKSLKGFNYTLNRLYPTVETPAAAVHVSDKLRKTAKTASEIAASVVATNWLLCGRLVFSALLVTCDCYSLMVLSWPVNAERHMIMF